MSKEANPIPVHEIQLGAVDGDNARLAASLPAKVEAINGGNNYHALEWLSRLSRTARWAYKAIGPVATKVIERFNGREERLAKASKTRNEGKAVLVANAELTQAKAETERAKARQEHAKADAAVLETISEVAKLKAQLEEQGIQIAAELRDGRLHVAVVKPEAAALPPKKKPSRARRKK